MRSLLTLSNTTSQVFTFLLLGLFSVEDNLDYSIYLSIDLQAYSSDEEEEMLIVVLDDDDDLVVGKSKQATSNSSSYSNNRSRTPQHNNRGSPTQHRNSPGKSSKRRDYPNKPKNQGYNNRDQRQTNSRPQQRPQINVQKLSQRLNNIKQEQSRQSSRGASPRKDRGSAENSPSLPSSMHSSHHSDSGFTDRPHAVIAKPVERRRKKRRPRPDPEGASLDPSDMDELDKLIYSDEPIFSDYGTDDESNSSATPQRRPGFSIAAFAIGLGLNSNTMIKYTIISTELQNIIRVSLKMVRRNYFLLFINIEIVTPMLIFDVVALNSLHSVSTVHSVGYISSHFYFIASFFHSLQ